MGSWIKSSLQISTNCELDRAEVKSVKIFRQDHGKPTLSLLLPGELELGQV